MARTVTSETPQGTAVPLLARLAVAGITLYVALDILAQVLPPHYSPVRHPGSDLALGPYGWIMTVNFVVRGLLSAAVLTALPQVLPGSVRARIGLALLGVWTGGAFLLAAFPTDLAGEHTVHGTLHLLIALLAFVSMPAAALLLSRCLSGDPRWTGWSRPLTGAAALVAGALVLLLGGSVTRVGGATERLYLAAALFWLLLVALSLRDVSARVSASPSSRA